MSTRAAAWLVWSLAAALALNGISFSVLNRTANVAGEREPVPSAFVILGFATLGLLVSYRRPGNAVGWIITGMGILYRYDAARTLEGFSEKLRDETDLATLHTELLSVIQETLQSAHVIFWLAQAKEGDD
jgi:hypothetical protein